MKLIAIGCASRILAISTAMGNQRTESYAELAQQMPSELEPIIYPALNPICPIPKINAGEDWRGNGKRKKRKPFK